MNARITAHRDGAQPTVAPLHRNRDYLLMVAAGTISSVGSKVSQVALPFLVLGLTESPFWAGLLGAAQLLPYLLVSLPAGAWVDRVNRKRLLVGCDLLRAVLLATIPLAYVAGILTIVHLCIVVFVVGVCTVLFDVADLAALPQVVPESQLARARSLSEGIAASAAVVGPSLSGILVGLGRSTVSGSILAYLVDSVSYLVSAIGLQHVRRSLQVVHTQPYPSLRKAMRQGLHFLWHHPTLRLLMLLTTSVNFLQAPVSLLFVLVAQQRFGLPPTQIGLLLGLPGGAALIGSFLTAWFYRSTRLYLILVGSLLVWTVAAFIMGIAPDVLTLTLGLALIQLVWPLYAVAVVSYRLSETPQYLQGRVISSFRMLSYGAEPLGLAIGGLAVTLTSPSLIFGFIGLGLLICTGVVIRRSFATPLSDEQT